MRLFARSPIRRAARFCGCFERGPERQVKSRRNSDRAGRPFRATWPCFGNRGWWSPNGEARRSITSSTPRSFRIWCSTCLNGSSRKPPKSAFESGSRGVRSGTRKDSVVALPVRAGEALRVYVNAKGEVTPVRIRDLLQRFQAALTAVNGQTSGRREAAAVEAYAAASDAYKYFLRFRLLDVDAVQGMVLLRGGNHDVAARYGLSIDRLLTSRPASNCFAD